MATNKLTDRAILTAKPRTKEYELTDGGGLALRVRPDGSKLWAVRLVSPVTGKRPRVYLGSYPDLSLQDARTKAAERRSLIAKGLDPAGAGALLDKEGEQAPATVGELFKVWFEKHVERNRTNENDRASIQSRYDIYVGPQIGSIPLFQVRRGQIMKSIDGARDGGKMRTANLVLGELRQMFRFAVAREWMQGDPTAAITRKDAGGTDNEGDRVLSDEELVMVRDALAKPPEGGSRYYVAKRRVLPIRTELAIWWTLATAGRAIEIASMQPRDVSKVRAQWLILAAIAKNDEAHVVHLSSFAMAVWRRLEFIAGDKYVFEGRKEGTHVSEKEVTRRLTDRQTRAKPVKGRKNATVLDLPGGHWTQHDLRRTASTIMGEAGVPSEVIDRCLNHWEAKKVTRTYQRQKMMPQRKAAFDLLGEHLTKILGDPEAWLPNPEGFRSPATVVPLRKTA